MLSTTHHHIATPSDKALTAV